MKRIFRSQKGQTMVIVVMAMIGLLGAVALAVDGSMVMADRRLLQSAADNAAMSAAASAGISMDNAGVNHQTFLCDAAAVQVAEVAALNTAIARAASYNYPIDTDISDKNGVQVTCHISIVAGLIDRYLDVTVNITNPSRTAFSRFVFPNGISNIVEAASRVHPRRSLSRGNAIASLNPACGGINIGGKSKVTISGGGIFSNSCLKFNGATDIIIDVAFPYGIGYMDTYTETNNVDIIPATLIPEKSTEGLETVVIPTTDCLTLTDKGSLSIGAGTQTIDPGRYNGIAISGTGHLIMNPGLYCLYSTFSTNGGQTVEVNPASPIQQGVTLFMANGNVSFNGNSLINLRAPSIDQLPAIKGMLVYMPPNNPGTVTLTGTSGSYFRGTIYAATGNIIAGGTHDITFATELIGFNVSVVGDAVITITDDASLTYTRPPLIELTK
jgi:hypothetical protein